MINKTSDIILRVGLDEEHIPEKIQWRAEGNPNASDFQEVKAFALALFDHKTFDTLRIDLWTKDMQVNEMDMFIYHTLKSMAQTYAKATSNNDLAGEMHAFANHFGKSTEIIKDDQE